MKKSEAKEYIKELIVAELIEVDADKTRGTVVMPKASNPQDVKKLTAQGIDVELKEEEEDVEPTASDIAANASIAKLIVHDEISTDDIRSITHPNDVYIDLKSFTKTMESFANDLLFNMKQKCFS